MRIMVSFLSEHRCASRAANTSWDPAHEPALGYPGHSAWSHFVCDVYSEFEPVGRGGNTRASPDHPTHCADSNLYCPSNLFRPLRGSPWATPSLAEHFVVRPYGARSRAIPTCYPYLFYYLPTYLGAGPPVLHYLPMVHLHRKRVRK